MASLLASAMSPPVAPIHAAAPSANPEVGAISPAPSGDVISAQTRQDTRGDGGNRPGPLIYTGGEYHERTPVGERLPVSMRGSTRRKNVQRRVNFAAASRGSGAIRGFSGQRRGATTSIVRGMRGSSCSNMRNRGLVRDSRVTHTQLYKGTDQVYPRDRGEAHSSDAALQGLTDNAMRGNTINPVHATGVRDLHAGGRAVQAREIARVENERSDATVNTFIASVNAHDNVNAFMNAHDNVNALTSNAALQGLTNNAMRGNTINPVHAAGVREFHASGRAVQAEVNAQVANERSSAPVNAFMASVNAHDNVNVLTSVPRANVTTGLSGNRPNLCGVQGVTVLGNESLGIETGNPSNAGVRCARQILSILQGTAQTESVLPSTSGTASITQAANSAAPQHDLAPPAPAQQPAVPDTRREAQPVATAQAAASSAEVYSRSGTT
ncbi:uncharacterized protein LOC128641156 [Bombina bombina]|uniref:uncharacterized protein LOC128641156 n=1 Tax=Bombina bombina TaxID=8345 RepID=UPI00235B25ED|nr:uncharacterized protein LOC128641156 [Bombina bombina]